MVNDDFFLQYRPFLTEPRNYYEAHYHEIIGSFLFYHLLYLSSPVISKAIFGKHYEVLSKRGKSNFDIHIVSMVQCLISIGVIVPLAGNKHLNENQVLNYLPYAGFVSAITVGYFIWDLYVCIRYFKLFGVGFLIHAAAALFAFGVTLYPFCLGWVAAFLSFELSTPFVNINWFINKLPVGSVPFALQAINGILLIVTFFVVRIIWGFYAIYLVTIQLYNHRDQVPLWLSVSVVFINLSLDILNVYWFKKMLQIALKKSGGSRAKPTDAKKDE